MTTYQQFNINVDVHVVSSKNHAHMDHKSNPLPPKDYTTYDLNGATYGKGPLVLEVVRDYVQKTPNISFAALERKFPKQLQGSYGVICQLDKAEDIRDNSPKKRKRHFLKSDQHIQISDCTVVVCTEWHINNIGDFISHARSNLNYAIIER